MKKTTLLYLFLSAVGLGIPLIPMSVRAAAGDLYVPGNNSIVKITPAGVETVFASGFGLGDIIEGLAFDDAGNLFVADAGPGVIFKFTPAGSKSTFASGLGAPTGLAFDGTGNLFVAGGNSILKFTPDGASSTFASGLHPGLLAFDRVGNLFVSDAVSNAILKFTPAGARTTFASGLNIPGDLAFDGSGNLFEADEGSGTIFKFTPAGTKSTFASGLSSLGGLAFDREGNLFVSSRGSIFKFTPAGIRTTFASNVGGFIAFEPVTEKLRNISARGFVQTGDNVLIAGLIVGGNALANNGVVVRAIGPSLSNSGIANPLQDPMLELHNASGALLASNDNWQDTQEAQIISRGLAPTNAHESAIFATLPAGAFTAIVRGANNTTGVAVVEVYSVQ